MREGSDTFHYAFEWIWINPDTCIYNLVEWNNLFEIYLSTFLADCGHFQGIWAFEITSSLTFVCVPVYILGFTFVSMFYHLMCQVF